MPYLNGKYTNPGWKNGEEPPISADNLNDISDALQDITNGSISGVQQGDSLLSSDFMLYITGKHPVLNSYPNDYWQYENTDLIDFFNEKLKQYNAVTGSYGSSNSNRNITINCDHAPNLIIIVSNSSNFPYVFGIGIRGLSSMMGVQFYSQDVTQINTTSVTWGNNSVVLNMGANNYLNGINGYYFVI